MGWGCRPGERALTGDRRRDRARPHEFKVSPSGISECGGHARRALRDSRNRTPSKRRQKPVAASGIGRAAPADCDSSNSSDGLGLSRSRLSTSVSRTLAGLRSEENAMAAHNDWSTPKAVAIPKEGYFTLEQGRYGADLSANARVSRLHDHREDQAGHRGRDPRLRHSASRRPSTRTRTRSRRCSCITCDGCCSTSAPTSTSCTRASSIRTSTSTPRTRSSCSRRRASTRSSRSSKDFRRTGRRTPRPSSSSSASTSVRASSSTANIRTSRAGEIKKALALKQAFSAMLDQMQ